MTLREIILAFLAARYPAAFPTLAITARINGTGLQDTPISNEMVQAELQILARKFEFVAAETDNLTGAVAWSATTSGIREWHISGQLHVG